MKKCSLLFLVFCLFISANIFAQISNDALNDLINDTTVRTGIVGISIYEPATGNYLLNYNADKNFTPASNTKLFALYAGMKYLGDSLVGIRYKREKNGISIYPTGDPTFLHSDFKTQKVFNFLKSQNNIEYKTQQFCNYLGSGWVWNDYIDDYMAPRSEMPIYENLITISQTSKGYKVIPSFVKVKPLGYKNQFTNNSDYPLFKNFDSNVLFVNSNSKNIVKDITPIPMSIKYNEIPFYLSDTLHKKILFSKDNKTLWKNVDSIQSVYSQPSDSLFKIMMSRSDNFFAEQTLLMASNELLGYMSDEEMIDTLLKTDLKNIPTKPRWVDGSGLSRYNLFSPKDFVFLLDKMKKIGRAHV